MKKEIKMNEVPIKQRKKKITRRENAEMREGKTSAKNRRGGGREGGKTTQAG